MNRARLSSSATAPTAPSESLWEEARRRLAYVEAALAFLVSQMPRLGREARRLTPTLLPAEAVSSRGPGPEQKGVVERFFDVAPRVQQSLLPTKAPSDSTSDLEKDAQTMGPDRPGSHSGESALDYKRLLDDIHKWIVQGYADPKPAAEPSPESEHGRRLVEPDPSAGAAQDDGSIPSAQPPSDADRSPLLGRTAPADRIGSSSAPFAHDAQER